MVGCFFDRQPITTYVRRYLPQKESVPKIRENDEKGHLSKRDRLVQSKLKLIKELASRSCGMGVIASELGMSESNLFTLRKRYKDIDQAYEDGRNLLKKIITRKNTKCHQVPSVNILEKEDW